MITPLPHLPDIEKLSPRVIRILGGNPSRFCLQGTNTYLIGTGSSRILIDTGEGKPFWPCALSSVLKSEGAVVSHVLLTHWHPDHVGGVFQLLSLSPKAKVYENEPPEGVEEISHGQMFETVGATLRAFHCPGHTINHMAFVLEEEDAMFTGDNVLGHGTAVFEDLATYVQSLGKMREQFTGRAYPAHGAVIEDGPEKIAEYIEHRKEREEQVLHTVKDVCRDGGATPMEIVKIIYQGYPEDVHEHAAMGVLQILKKLEGEDKISHIGEDRWGIITKATL
ncbi:MAG: hypothetical protein Q9163_005911 [Psora crenata]